MPAAKPPHEHAAAQSSTIGLRVDLGLKRRYSRMPWSARREVADVLRNVLEEFVKSKEAQP